MTNEEKRMIVQAARKIEELEARIAALEAAQPKRRRKQPDADRHATS